jgi:hypothetical protein
LNAQALVDKARAAGIKFAMADGQVRLAEPTPAFIMYSSILVEKA